MKEWHKLTHGQIETGDIVDTDGGTTHRVRGISHDKTTGTPIIELEGHRPLTGPAQTKIEVYR